MRTPRMMLTGPEKAVLFLLSLEEHVAAPIVAELKESELRTLRAVASTMSEVRPDALERTYEEFVERSTAKVAVPRGGLPYLRRLAAGALGEERARHVFEDQAQSGLERLEAAPPDALAHLLENEPDQLVGAVLARLEPETAANVICAMPLPRQATILARIGSMTELPESAVEDVAAALLNELPSASDETTVSIDGVSRAAQILNAAGRVASLELLKSLEDREPDLAKDVRLAMFTFEDLRRIDKSAMRTLLREVPTERLTLALKGAPDDVRDAIFGGLSSRAAELIRDDLELLGNVRRSEIEKARIDVIQVALRMEAEGRLDLGRGGE